MLVHNVPLVACLAIALSSVARADLTSAQVPDFRGWENTTYAGWNGWTVLANGDFTALPDDPATTASDVGFWGSFAAVLAPDVVNGVLCVPSVPSKPEFRVDYVDSQGRGVSEVVMQLRHPGATIGSAYLQYIGDVPMNPDSDVLPAVEIVALAGDETLIRFTASQVGLPLGVFGGFSSFSLYVEMSSMLGTSCIDEIQMDVRHALEGESAAVCVSGASNSLGMLAGLDAAGSSVAGDNVFQLTATGLPAASFGLMLASESMQFGPCQSGCGQTQGVLCLSGAITRLGPPQLAGVDRSFSHALDLTSVPTNPATSVLAGSTWYFQAWFRDANPLPTSNFTLTTAVDFR